eukprot:gb/GECG01010773.1/.p1 GENE.gb/GECG01010773.1/~~gb/GECG01010773.1/.p1  ORF type:complete len:128 (+),score=12.05 gb/GECG01010773.1/:1-384(+)
MAQITNDGNAIAGNMSEPLCTTRNHYRSISYSCSGVREAQSLRLVQQALYDCFSKHSTPIKTLRSSGKSLEEVNIEQRQQHLYEALDLIYERALEFILTLPSSFTELLPPKDVKRWIKDQHRHITRH